MKKKIVKMIIMMSAVTMLAACTNNGGKSRGPYTEPDEVIETPDKPAKPTPADPEPAIDPEPEITGPEHIFEDEFKNGEVEGQGTHFIRVGRKVYYRVLANDGMEETALFGEFLNNEKIGVASELWVYDLDTTRYDKVMDIDGVGELYAGVQGLFISDGMNKISVIDPLNKTQTPYAEGSIIKDVSDDGTLLMITGYDPANCQHGQICKDGEYICHTSEANSSLTFFGLAGDNMIALYHKNESDEYQLVSYHHNIMTILGELTLPGDVMWPYPELIEYIAEGDQVYLTLGYYEGTGHFLTTWDAYSMTAGVRDSLVLLDKEDHDFTGDEMTEPKMLIDNGEVDFYKVVGNELGLSNEYYGDLIYHDGPYGATVLAEYLIDEMDTESWVNKMLEGVVLDDTAFVITSFGHHIPSQDIGWRYAYSPESLTYMAVPFGPDAERNEDGVPKDRIYLNTVSPCYVDKDEVAALAGSDWDFYSYEVEGEYELALYGTYGRHLHFEDNGDITMTVENRVDNTSQTYTIKRKDDPDYDSYYINYELDNNGKSPEHWVLVRLLDGYLEFSVDWTYDDGTFGGANYVFQPEFDG